jgi:hypothetical protein
VKGRKNRARDKVAKGFGHAAQPALVVYGDFASFSCSFMDQILVMFYHGFITTYQLSLCVGYIQKTRISTDIGVRIRFTPRMHIDINKNQLLN